MLLPFSCKGRCFCPSCREKKVLLFGEFIAAITRHIPDKGFQVVRYYGWYSNRARGERTKHEAETGTPDSANVAVKRNSYQQARHYKIPHD